MSDFASRHPFLRNARLERLTNTAIVLGTGLVLGVMLALAV